jgi:hypothetical protein
MRKSLIMLSLIILGTGLGLSPAIPANAVLITNLCTAATYNGNHQCLNLWEGLLANGATIKYYHHGGGNIQNEWAPADDGAVVGVNCGGSGQRICWPFTTGSGMNAKYNGDNVYVFEYGQSPSWCMDQGKYNVYTHNGSLQLWRCLNNSNQQFVWTGSDWNVDVYATNAQWARDGNQNNIPVWTSSLSNNVTDGALAQMSHSCPQYCQFQFTAP